MGLTVDAVVCVGAMEFYRVMEFGLLDRKALAVEHPVVVGDQSIRVIMGSGKSPTLEHAVVCSTSWALGAGRGWACGRVYAVLPDEAR